MGNRSATTRVHRQTMRLPYLGRAAPEEIKVQGRGDQQLGSISKRECEKRARDERRRTHQCKIESCGFSQERKTQGDLPGASHSKIAPGPRSKNWKQRQQDPAGQWLWFEAAVLRSECFGELKKKVNASSGNQSGQNAGWKILDQWCFLQKCNRQHANYGPEGKG